MSLDDKPHISEPVVVASQDDFGNTVFTMTDAWFNYFNSLDTEINTEITQNIISQSISNSTQIDVHVSQFEKSIKELESLKSIVLGLNQVNEESLMREISHIKAMLAQLMSDQGQQQGNNLWALTPVNLQD